MKINTTTTHTDLAEQINMTPIKNNKLSNGQPRVNVGEIWVLKRKEDMNNLKSYLCNYPEVEIVEEGRDGCIWIEAHGEISSNFERKRVARVDKNGEPKPVSCGYDGIEFFELYKKA